MTEAKTQASAPETSAPTSSSDIAAAASKSEGNFSIPDEYKEAGWAKDIKSSEDLWKMNANAQSLIGKRPAGIPASDAPPEEWDKFYNAAGRPEDPSGYKFSDVEGLPEGFDPEPLKNQAAGILHEAGLNQQQADAVYKKYLQTEVEALKGQQEDLDKQFEELSKEHFDGALDEQQEVAIDFANKYVPEQLREGFAGLENNPKALAAIVSMAKGAQEEIRAVKAKYGAEDKLESGGQSAGQSVDEIRTQLAKLNTSEANRQFDHPDHKNTRQKIEELRGQLGRALK